MTDKMGKILVSVLVASSLFASNLSATVIDLTYDTADFSGTEGAVALAGFQQAANFWENMFTDDITVNLNIGFSALGAGILGGTNSSKVNILYNNTAVAMYHDATSASDALAVNNLECVDTGIASGAATGACGMTFLGVENDGSGGLVTEHDLGDANLIDDNNFVYMTQANAKALGFTQNAFGDAFSDVDAGITFSSDFLFDFDRSDGIDFDKWDFVGLAIHEIGHALGFVSGVDLYDLYTGSFDLDNIGGIASTLDLFRYSDESAAIETTNIFGGITGTKDFRPGGDTYFSIDGGVTNIAPMSTGQVNGDGDQASHWKDHLDIGAMDPTLANGEFIDVTGFDILAFDVIGWDIASDVFTQVPTPTSITLFGFAAAAMFSRRRKLT